MIIRSTIKKGQFICGDQLVVSSNNIARPSTKITVSPNPATESITISGFRTGTVIIFSLDGWMLKQVKNYVIGQKLTTSDLTTGIYILSVSTDNGTLTSKLTVK